MELADDLLQRYLHAELQSLVGSNPLTYDSVVRALRVELAYWESERQDYELMDEYDNAQA